ncbi:RNA polymerase sigma-54 factor [Catenovulum agarivorans DS-2]|uniref:RNA polymerase sigma-54 factor n=1 Tax=Catenovulum agarivorans DS-2 TaxID=1328313 RepID=W7QMI2_9ALTE|nr:RNA polymerase factor sigma-54 [Catenovulum agarivorans]EWH09128.1 RNA polymerase sigma-54 factor [Catenovulum agarivorans DS-2]
MKQTIQLKFGQHLTMTPQLQQAIRLLQLSSLDLQQEIQEALDSNPLLDSEENREEFESLDAINEAKQQKEEKSTKESTEQSDDAVPDSRDELSREDIREDLATDSTWDDHFTQGTGSGSSSGGAAPDDDMVYQGETITSIRDHLLWQMDLTPFSPVDRAIAISIIDAVDDSGYLTVSIEDIIESLGIESQEIEDLVEIEEVEAVLKRIQLFDPVGVASRDTKECLLVQLNQFAPDTPYLKETKKVIKNYIELLGNRDYRTLARKTRLKEDELKEVMKLIHSLNPRPGNAVVAEEAQYIVPDVAVKKVKDDWVVELNPDSMPRLKINAEYAAMSKTARNTSDSQFIRSHMQEAKWFIKSLESRNETLLKVARCIVKQQQGFFEYGDEAMKPMVLNDVAEEVEMHESTISRVTTQKYMHTPRGIFELKYFFSSHVSTENGGECSSTAIRALIKKLISAENTAKPLSDSKIAELLADQGIKVARRTIAKYRESLSIPPSNQRKSLL